MSIRPAGEQDAQAISKLIHRTIREVNVREYGEEGIAPLLEWNGETRIREALRSMEFLVCEKQGQIVGVGGLDTMSGYLSRGYVLPEWQGKGIGTALLERLESIARSHRMQEVHLDATLTSTRFLERRGYHPLGERVASNGFHYIPMTKRLA